MADARVVDIEDYRSRLMAQAGPLRCAGVELSLAGDRVVLTLPSGHVEEISGSEAVALGGELTLLGEWAQDVPDFDDADPDYHDPLAIAYDAMAAARDEEGA